MLALSELGCALLPRRVHLSLNLEAIDASLELAGTSKVPLDSLKAGHGVVAASGFGF